MSEKELKALREYTEQLKDQLKAKTDMIKGIRADIRSATNAIKQKNQEIAGSESKLNEHSNKLDDSDNESNLDNNEALKGTFNRIVYQQLFEPIKSLKESQKSKDKNVVSVDVKFQDVTISFFVSHNDTFEDLRNQVASYWAMPVDEIFFSDQDSDDCGVQPLFLLHDKVVQSLYIWQRAKLKSQNFLLYLVLRNYTSLTERMEQLFPKELESENHDAEADDPAYKLIGTSKKKEKPTQFVDKKAELAKRKKWIRIQYTIQWALFLTVFLLWSLMLTYESTISKSTWINKSITKNLIWNFKFDDMESLTLYSREINSKFLKVTNEKLMWDYVENFLALFTSDDEYGIMNSHLYSLEYFEIRQVRTKVKTCSYKGIFNYTCSGEYNVFLNSYEKDLDLMGNESAYVFEQYTSRNPGMFVYGDLAVYPIGGYLNNVNLLDDDEFYHNISTLKEKKWIDEGTRAIIITLNIYSPSSDIITMIMPYFEISSSGYYLQNFKMYTINRHPFSDSVQTVHGIILILTFFLLLLELRQNIRHPNETKIFIYNSNLQEAEKLFEDLMENSRRNLFNRFKKPSKDEIFSLFTIVSLLILEIISLSLYYGSFKDKIKIEIGYTNLFGGLQGVAMLNDTKHIMTLLLAMNVLRFIIIWMAEVSKYFQVIIDVFSQVGYYVSMTICPIVILSIFYYYFLGPFDRAFNSMEQAFVSTIRIFCGHWPSNRTFQYFIDSGFLVISYFVLIIWRTLVLNFQVILFQMGIAKIQLQN